MFRVNLVNSDYQWRGFSRREESLKRFSYDFLPVACSSVPGFAVMRRDFNSGGAPDGGSES